MNRNFTNKFRGCLLGLAVGDALGTTLEFRSPGTFNPLDDMVGGGPFGLLPGQWTDDTSMALCLAESLISCKGMDLADQCERYLDWWLRGSNSVTGECFDIGNTVRSALAAYRQSGDPRPGPTDNYSAGNGSIMRLAPVPLFYYSQTRVELLARCEESSLTTHGASESIWSCRILGALICQAMEAESKEEVLTFDEELLAESVHGGELSPGLTAILSGSFRNSEPPLIQGTGYVVKSLEAALWAFAKADDFRRGALLAANLGDDADTTAAIYGQLAGAFWGESGIPTDWLAKLAWREKITSLSDQLQKASANR
ncbi:ADP-ribosylglycohydrolase family protein [Roseibacillus persicicus]|uniref:ADP-ribosylglycohydrolase family protein n=1 Tax=Roseibacillus persicicus TaxID=454148 RepID=UPI00398B7E59